MFYLGIRIESQVNGFTKKLSMARIIISHLLDIIISVGLGFNFALGHLRE